MSKPAPWRPTLAEAWKLSRGPMLFYLAFTVSGFIAFFLSIAIWDNGSELGLFIFSSIAGFLGIVAGQIASLARLRFWLLFVIGLVSAVFGAVVVSAAGGDIPKEIAVPAVFFLFAFPCGVLSLQHRFELFSLFWPGIGWIGGVMVILNKEDRITNWEQNKLTAWLPVPLFFLACFLAFMLVFFAMKQSQRVRLWEALSGAVERRVTKKKELPAPPRRNTLPLLVVFLVLFAFTAVLAPFLWRTGRGDHDGDNGKKTEEMDKNPHQGDGDEDRNRGPKFDGEAIAKMLEQVEQSAKHNARYLLPLLLLLALYRPLKRAFVVSHLKTPIFPSSPSERIENLWEYVRIAAEDSGVEPLSSDSIEELVTRVGKRGSVPLALGNAAQIYARSRYSFAIAPGDALRMRHESFAAVSELTRTMGVWLRFKTWWRPLR